MAHVVQNCWARLGFLGRFVPGAEEAGHVDEVHVLLGHRLEEPQLHHQEPAAPTPRISVRLARISAL
eukprot:3702312-Rhodomonas_salina.1